MARAIIRSLRNSHQLASCALAIVLGAACGEPDLWFIAGGRSALPDAGPVGDAGSVTDAGSGAPPVVTAQVRQRVRVAGTSLVTDRGTLLRGIDIPIDLTPGFPLNAGLFVNMAQTQGLNAVQVYLEYWGDQTGSHLAQADQIIDQAGAAGLYVILGIGGGPPGDGHPGNGWFDINKVRSFWQLYGPRYKDRTHVIYQLQNQPDLSCNAPWPADTIAMEREGYTLLRSLAPDTHIILFSYREMPTPAQLGGGIDQLSDLVDWSNASVGMGGIPNCVQTPQFADTFAMATSRRAPVFITALPMDGWGNDAVELERDHVGWTSIRWLVHLPDFATFQDDHAQAGVTWCPDFGAWPQDSTVCWTR
jgi:hypothetical protein